MTSYYRDGDSHANQEMPMDTRNLVRIALCLTGEYDIPERTLTVSGTGADGGPVVHTVPDVDVLRLERDVMMIMDGATDRPLPPSGFNIRGEPVR